MRMGNEVMGALALAGAAALWSTSASAGPDPRGIWFNDTGRGAIEIKSCGENLCGEVVWVKDASDEDGCGRKIIGDAKPAGGNVWDGGWIYNPEKKKTYDVELTPLDENRLRVKGYAGTKFLSKTMIWTRAPAELIRCHTKSEQVAAAAPEAASNAAPPVTATESTAPKDAAPALKPSVSETPKAGTPEPRKEANARPKTETKTEPKASRDSDFSEVSEKFGDIITRTGDRCKLDLPWVKVNFTCDGK